MNLQFYLEKLNSSEVFKEFMKENPDAFFCSGFFSIDKQGNDNQQHFDFFVPKTNEMFSFKLEDEIEKLPMENFQGVPEKILEDCDFSLEEVERVISNEMEKKDVKTKMRKIFLSLQRNKDKHFIIGTVFIAVMGLVRIDIDVSNMNVTFFEKKSFMDMVRVVKKDDKDNNPNQL
ncbi:MAG TPA: hypothetical protein VMC80_02395 [Patescibacteria group bacterium]|nr:hypothetical protein [Patescibacteria group bacterium]